MVKIKLTLYTHYRKIHNWNDKIFAKKLGFSHAYLSRLLNSQRAPSSYFIEKYLDFTHFVFEQAFVCNGDPSYQQSNYPKFNGEKRYNEFGERGEEKS